MPKVVHKEYACYLGIDPGVNGGLVLLGPCNQVISTKMPSTERDIWEYLCAYQDYKCLAAIEWINPAIQKIGKSTMSKLYGNYMSLRMSLIASGIPFEPVQPAKWQRAIGISPRGNATPSEWKNRLKAKAQEVFPSETITLATADALLIALYCKRKSEGTL